MSAHISQMNPKNHFRPWLQAEPRWFDSRKDWQMSVCQSFVPLEIESRAAGQFINGVANESHGFLQISELITAAQCVRRTRSLANKSEAAQYKLSIQLAGRTQIEQDGRRALLLPGDWGIYDTSRPYEVSVDDHAHFLVLQTPVSALAAWESRIQSRVARRYGSDSGSARIALDALRSLINQGGLLLPELAPDVSATVLQLFTLSLGEHADGSGASSLQEVREGQLRVILRHIQDNLHDCDMSASSLALRFRMSRRYLYNLFAMRSLTPADYILGARLDRCRELLAEPGCTRQIRELAHAHGFTDASAFSHAFKRKFGLSPSDWRTQQVAGR